MKARDSKIVAAVSIALSALVVLGAFLAVWLVPREPGIASAQNSTETAKPSQISVVGTGIISLRPDILRVTVGVSMQESTVTDAQDKVNAAMSAIQEKLKAAGIDEKDYKTAQYTIEPVMDFDGSKGGAGKLSGFRVVNMIEITFRDPARAPKVIDSLISAGANTVYGTSYGLANPEAATQQAYDGAMKDAQARAEKIAQLSGMTLGKIISVSESANGPIPVYGKDMGMGAGGGLAPGQQTVQTSLIVVYEATPGK